MLNAFLVFPVLYALGLFSSELELGIVQIWNLVVTISFLVAINTLFCRPFNLYLFLFPVYVVVFVEWILIYLFDSRLSAGYIWIGLSNLDEYKEFFATYKSYLIPSVLAFLSFYLFCLYNIRNIRWRWGILPRWISVITFLMIYGVAVSEEYMKSGDFMDSLDDVIEHDQSIPIGILSQTAVVFQQLKKHHVGLERKKLSLGAYKKRKINKPELHVLVIGESSRKDHWSLYGYTRKTNPLLEKQDHMIVYDSVISNWPLTQMAVPLIVTDATIRQVYGFDHNIDVLKRPSILHAFKEANFKTLWLTNQSFDRFAGNINALTNDADITLYSTHKYDGSLIKLLKKQVKIEGLEKSLFVVLHTKGSHFKYQNRYPKEFSRFKQKHYNEPDQKLIDEYDNTILYTDYFLSSLIDYLNDLGIISSVTYISDHGENLYDDDRNLFGHNFSNQYDLPVPMFIWISHKNRDVYPYKWQYALMNKHKKADFCNIFYTILDLADLTYPKMKDSFSLVNRNYKEHERFIYNQRKHRFIRYESVR